MYILIGVYKIKKTLVGFFLVSLLVVTACVQLNPTSTQDPQLDQPQTQPPSFENDQIELQQSKPSSSQDTHANANVIYVFEGEPVNLKPEVEDPDNDDLLITFTSPLDKNGFWQTSPGDVGEYTVTLTVSDGTEAVSQDILIIVNKKDQAPEIIAVQPEENTIIVDEQESIRFTVKAQDANKDVLTYIWTLNDVEVSREESYVLETTIDDQGDHAVQVQVSDETSSVDHLWTVKVENINQPPTLEEIQDITVQETDVVELVLKATDTDGDEITYEISNANFKELKDNVFVWETDYQSQGTYTLQVIVSDGQSSSKQDVTITVLNKNRPPVIKDIVQVK